MSDTYKSLKVACAEAGTTLTEVCRRAGIHRQAIERWEQREPHQFGQLRKLNQAISEIKAENAAQTLPAESR